VDEVYGFRHAYGRCYVWRKCYVCGKQTEHAYLRGDDGRDEIECLMFGVDALRTAETVIGDMHIPTILQWLDDRDIRVEWRREDDKRSFARLTRYLDDGTFSLTLPCRIDSLTLMTLLEQAVRIIDAPESWLLWCVVPADADNPPLAFCPLVPAVDNV
jgi:hypothetical protein